MRHRSWFLALLVAPSISLAPTTGCGGQNASGGVGAVDSGSSSGDTGQTGMPDSGPPPDREVTELASLGSGVYTLQVDATAVYALLIAETAGASTQVMKIPLAGGTPVTLATDPEYSEALAVYGGTAYWVDTSGPPDDASTTDGLVMSVSTGGGTPAALARDQGAPVTVAADATGVYWGDASQCPQVQAQPPCTAVGGIVTLPAGGSTPVVLATGQQAPEAIALDATNVYWGTSDGRVMSIPKSGGTATQLAYYEANIQYLVVAGSNVYWTTGTGDVMQTPVAGGSTTAVVVGFEQITSIAADATNLYWAQYDEQDYQTPGSASVQRMSLAGGAPTTVWTGSDVPEALQVDATSVYFATDSGNVFRVTPK
ncbi:MAG TPA: hypothetical protein VGG39_00945 [Polyangiaceae bacterium]|jgi:hypothetical protein